MSFPESEPTTTESEPPASRATDGESVELPVELLRHLVVRHCASLGEYLARGELDSTTRFALMEFEDVYADELVVAELDSRTRLAVLRFRDAYGISEEDVLGPQTIEALTGPSTGACW